MFQRFRSGVFRRPPGLGRGHSRLSVPLALFLGLARQGDHRRARAVVPGCPGLGSPGEDACTACSECAKRNAAESFRKGFWSKLKIAYRELARGDAWNPHSMSGNPCDAPLVESCLACASAEQKKGGGAVKNAAPLLAHTLETLQGSMRTRSQLAQSVQERISITRDIALFALALYTMRRGCDLSFTLGS